VVMAVALLWFLGKITTDSKTAGKSGQKEQKSLGEVLSALPALFRNKTLVFLSTSSAFRSMTQNGVMAFLPLYLAKELGYNPWWVGMCMFALQAAGFVAGQVAGAHAAVDPLFELRLALVDGLGHGRGGDGGGRQGRDRNDRQNDLLHRFGSFQLVRRRCRRR